MEKKFRNLHLVFAYLFIVSFCFAENLPKILYINSYSLSYSISRSQLDGVREIFTPQKAELTVEFLNSKKYPNDDIQDKIQETLLIKLREDFEYDAVLISDDNALKFVENNYEEFFTEIPLVFFGINSEAYASQMANKTNIAGLVEEISVYDNLYLIKKLYPDKKLAVISDGTAEGSTYLNRVLAQTDDEDLTVINLEKISWEEFPEKVKELNNIPLLVIAPFRDKNFETKFLDESFKIIKDNHNGAIFCLLENIFDIGGVLGGKVVNHYEYAKEASMMILSAFDGSKNTNIGLARGANKYMIDYNELKRLKFSQKVFPPETIFVNKPETIWSKYRFHISLFVIIAFIAYALNIILLFYIKSKNSIEKELNESKSKLKKSKNELRRIIDLIPSHIYIKDKDTRFILINKTSADSFDMSPAEVEGMTHISLHENPEELIGFMEEDKRIINGEVEEILQYNNIVTIKNQKKYFHTIKVPYVTDEGENAVLGISTEVTERTLMQKELEKKNSELLDRTNEIIETQRDVIEKLGNIIEHRSKETANHVKRVSKMARLLAEKLGVNQKQVELIEIAVPMHDVGKIGIKEEILHKPGKLTEIEFEEIKKHSEIGFHLLEGSNREILQTAAIIAHEHHERWDGTGYPNGKRESEIHLFGRITSIVDVFDALTSKRSYKEAWPIDKAFAFIVSQKEKMFDPRLVDLFIASRKEIEGIKEEYKD